MLRNSEAEFVNDIWNHAFGRGVGRGVCRLNVTRWSAYQKVTEGDEE